MSNGEVGCFAGPVSDGAERWVQVGGFGRPVQEDGAWSDRKGCFHEREKQEFLEWQCGVRLCVRLQAERVASGPCGVGAGNAGAGSGFAG